MQDKLKFRLDKLSLTPADVLVVQCDGFLTAQEATRLRETIKAHLPDTKLMILDRYFGVSLTKDEQAVPFMHTARMADGTYRIVDGAPEYLLAQDPPSAHVNIRANCGTDSVLAVRLRDAWNGVLEARQREHAAVESAHRD